MAPQPIRYAPRVLRLSHALLNLGPVEPLARRLALLAAEGVRPTVLGAGRVVAGPLLVAGSHPRGQDFSLLLAAVRRPLEVVVDESAAALPLIGLSLRARGVHVLRRVTIGFDERNAAVLADTAEAVRSGAAVAIFPHGFSGRVGSGAARIAAMARSPVLVATILVSSGLRARPRALVALSRPLAPPAPDARSRRRFRDRLARRFRAEALPEVVLDLLLDDPRRWRRPERLLRLPRTVEARAVPLARAVRRGCLLLRCSAGDLREPPGVRHLAAWALLGLAALGGLALCGPPILFLRVKARSVPDKGDRRRVRLHGAIMLAAPWGIVLAGTGFALFGVAGLSTPLVALAGICCRGPARHARRRMACLFAVRRSGARLSGLLREFDAAVATRRGRRPQA